MKYPGKTRVQKASESVNQTEKTVQTNQEKIIKGPNKMKGTETSRERVEELQLSNVKERHNKQRKTLIRKRG